MIFDFLIKIDNFYFYLNRKINKLIKKIKLKNGW